MKKIVFFSHDKTTGGIDGANNVLLRIVSGLPAERYDLLVIVPDYGILYQELQKSGINTRVFDYDCADFDGFVYGDHDKSSIDPICKNMEAYLEQSEIYEFLREWKPDIVYANTTMGILAAVLGKMVGAKVIWHIHDILRNFLGEQDCINTHKIIDRYADKIVVVGKAVRRELGTLGYSHKCELVYIGMKNPGLEKKDIWEMGVRIKQRLGVATDMPIIAFLGRISREKGIDHFIKAASIVLKTHKRCKFIIIGSKKYDEQYYEELNQLIANLKLQESISFVGFYQNIADIIPAIDCLVIPSVYEEPMALVTVEANYYYKPVIAYDRGGFSEAIINNKNGYLVKVDDIEKMADCISKIMSNKKETIEMGSFGYKRAVNKFDYERFMKTSIEIIDEVANGQCDSKPCRDGDIIRGQSQTCYLFTDGVKRIISSPSILNSLGLSEDDAVLVDSDIIYQMSDGIEVSFDEVIR